MTDFVDSLIVSIGNRLEKLVLFAGYEVAKLREVGAKIAAMLFRRSNSDGLGRQ